MSGKRHEDNKAKPEITVGNNLELPANSQQ